MKQNLRKLINYSIKKESKHLVLTLDELKEIQSADKRLRKLEKVIKILEDRFEIVAVKEDYDSEYIIETSSYFLYITKEQYKLLKEVLGNE